MESPYLSHELLDLSIQLFQFCQPFAWSKHLCFSNSWRRRSTATFASQLRMNLAPKAGTAGTSGTHRLAKL